MTSPVVVVHGSYHRPAHYERLAACLRARGAAALVPDIGGLELPDAVRRLQDLVDGLDTRPIVVGHSFGGAAAGALAGVRRMVFLTAWVLDTDETCTGLLQHAGNATGGAFAAALRPGPDDGHLHIDPAHAADLFYGDCSPADAARAVSLLRPDVAANFDHAPPAAHWRDTPTLYVRATRDRTWPESLPPLFAPRCAEGVTMSTSHSPFLTRPEEVADLVLRDG